MSLFFIGAAALDRASRLDAPAAALQRHAEQDGAHDGHQSPEALQRARVRAEDTILCADHDDTDEAEDTCDEEEGDGGEDGVLVALERSVDHESAEDGTRREEDKGDDDDRHGVVHGAAGQCAEQTEIEPDDGLDESLLRPVHHG